MMRLTWKRRLLDRIGNLIGFDIVRKGTLWSRIEPEHLDAFLRHFNVDCVFDVGANAGQYGLRLRYIGFNGTIISFEPNPRVAADLRIAARGDANWHIYELALDRSPRTVEFNVMKESEFSSLHAPSNEGTTSYSNSNVVETKLTLQTTTLAALYPDLKKKYEFSRPFLKMDTQGHDVAVVEGAGEFLKECVGLQSELAMTKLYEYSATYSEALEFYRNQGFKLSSLVPNHVGNFPDLHEIDCIMYNGAMT